MSLFIQLYSLRRIKLFLMLSYPMLSYPILPATYRCRGVTLTNRIREKMIHISEIQSNSQDMSCHVRRDIYGRCVGHHRVRIFQR